MPEFQLGRVWCILAALVGLLPLGAFPTSAQTPGYWFRRDPLPWAGGFLAGKAFLVYRRRGGAKTSPLPDFYIGAHAAIGGFTLLTRDPRRYRTYFPKLQILGPSEET